MKHNKAYIIFTLIVVACLTSLGIQAAVPLRTPSAPVTVVNGEDNPVIVTGVVSFENNAVTIDNKTENPVPVLVQNPVSVNGSEYRFVGNSISGSPLGGGIGSLDKECRLDYSNPLARMCNTQEYFDTPDRPRIESTTAAWIWPKLISSYYNPDKQGVEHMIYPDTTISPGGSLSVATCETWRIRDSRFDGTVIVEGINGDDYISSRNCTDTRPIACCAPR